MDCSLERMERSDSERLGMRFLWVGCWPGRMGVMARICSVCFSGVEPSLDNLLASSSSPKNMG